MEPTNEGVEMDPVEALSDERVLLDRQPAVDALRGTSRPGKLAAVRRRLSRLVLGALMSVVAAVAERRLRRALRR
jgi:hypothetical protein